MISRTPMMAGTQALTDVRSVSQPAPDQKALDQQVREALSLWLRWDREHQRLTELMFAAGQDRRRVEQLLDDCERMRHQAVKLSQQVLGES